MQKLQRVESVLNSTKVKDMCIEVSWWQFETTKSNECSQDLERKINLVNGNKKVHLNNSYTEICTLQWQRKHSNPKEKIS